MKTKYYIALANGSRLVPHGWSSQKTAERKLQEYVQKGWIRGVAVRLVSIQSDKKNQ